MRASVAMLMFALGWSPGPSAPITVTWEVIELTDTHAAVIAHIKRLAVVPYPLSVRIEVPAGATVSSGRTSFDVLRNEAPDEVSEKFEVTYPRRPANDLMLRVSGGTRAGGVSAAVPYRFGRSEPKTQPVAPEGDSVVINGRDLGPSVPLRQR